MTLSDWPAYVKIFFMNRLHRLVRAGQTSLVLAQVFQERLLKIHYCNLTLKMAVKEKKINKINFNRLEPMTPSACWRLLGASDYLCNKQEIQRFSPFQFLLKIRWYSLLNRKLRGTLIVRGMLEPRWMVNLQRLVLKLPLQPLTRVSGDPCITRTTGF